MKVSRKRVEEHLEERFSFLTRDANLRDEFCRKAEEEKQIPYSHAMDLVDFRISLSELPESELYMLIDVCNNNASNLRLAKYTEAIAFTESEIKAYKNLKYDVKGIKFPIVLDMFQINDNQWVGMTSCKKLMEFRRAQMINYNVNTQRTLQRIIRGEVEYWKIHINEKSVKDIAESLHNGMYIPNTITLNIPADDYEAEFYYNADKKQLVIKSLDHFDILDGYHRFLAMCRESDLNRKFDYPMELRITNFTEEQGKQFIFQEDQKTQMSKSDSKSMDQNRASNIVVDRLNANAIFYLKNSISRNKGMINYSDLSDMIEYLWFPARMNKKEERKLSVELPRKLAEWFNALADTDGKFASQKYSKERLASALVFAKAEDFQFDKKYVDQILETEISLKANNYNTTRRVIREAMHYVGG